MNVLICDDDLKIVQQIKNFLLKLSKQSTYNFDITCFSNGDSILDKQIKTDFAFIDIEMPGVNGLSVTKYLQTLNPNIIVFIVILPLMIIVKIKKNYCLSLSTVCPVMCKKI